jgi:hypothetical protein
VTLSAACAEASDSPIVAVAANANIFFMPNSKR